MRKAIYPGSFDPVTKGHLDMIGRSAQATGELIVGVGQNPAKKYVFSFPERVDLISGAIHSELGELLNIQVQPFSGMLVDYAYKHDIGHVIKGVRGGEDMEYEQLLYNAGETQRLGIETIMMFASPDKTHISSSATKGILKEQGDIRDFVTLNVKQALESRILEQYPVGITGTIGSGKSYITDQFVKLGKQHNITVHDIDLDKIGHYIISEGTEPGYVKIRQQLADEFGNEILDENGLIDRKILGPIVFGDEEKRKKLDDIMITPIGLQIREEMKGKKGIMLINGALLAEASTSSIANNNVVLIDVDSSIQKTRLSERGHTEEEIKRRVKSQFDTDMKMGILEQNITHDAHGKTMLFANDDSNLGEIEKQFFDILEEIDVYGELRVQAFFQKIGVGEKYLEIYSELKQLYDTPERSYHNWSHIVMGINEIYKQKNELSPESFMELFFAFLYHDVIYDAKQIRGENEEQSALFAEIKLKKINIKGLNINRVITLIRSTAKHKSSGKDEVIDLMIDIDMSILGSSWNKYSKYIKNIRQEYSCYSDKDFYTGRLKFLQGIKGKQIFYTGEYASLFEDQAQQNIQMEIVMMQKKGY